MKTKQVAKNAFQHKKTIPILGIGLLLVLTITSVLGQQRCGAHLFDSYSKYAPKIDHQIVTPRNASFTIPIVFHVFTANGINQSSFRAIQEQVDILNDHYNFVPPKGILYKEAQSLVSNPEITFHLAQKDPAGNETNGVIFYLNDDSTLGNIPNQAEARRIMHTELGGADAWDPERYLNVWVGPRSDGVLGDSSFPQPTIAEEDGVVINGAFVGFSDLHSQFGQGKTLVHEIGHYLGLKHPFGDEECKDHDFIEDTPPQARAYFGCPEYPQESCSSLDLIYNFMDFHDDDCLLFFTQGQVNLIQNTLNTSRKALANQEINTPNASSSLNNLKAFSSGNDIIIHYPDYAPLSLSASLYDLSGRQLFQQQIENRTLFRAYYPFLRFGVYLLVLENEEGYETRKIFIP